MSSSNVAARCIARMGARQKAQNVPSRRSKSRCCSGVRSHSSLRLFHMTGKRRRTWEPQQMHAVRDQNTRCFGRDFRRLSTRPSLAKLNSLRHRRPAADSCRPRSVQHSVDGRRKVDHSARRRHGRPKEIQILAILPNGGGPSRRPASLHGDRRKHER